MVAPIKSSSWYFFYHGKRKERSAFHHQKAPDRRAVSGQGDEAELGRCHDIAEQLEHINSERFYDCIDEMLGYPKADPHGEPIPDANGKVTSRDRLALSQVKEGASAKITAVGNDEKSFLDHLNSKGLQIGDNVMVKKRELFDGSMVIVMKSKKKTMLSHQVAKRI